MSKSVFLIGECGTGKTLMGSVVAHVVGQDIGRKYRVLVVGPPHLTRAGKRGSKWHREIIGTIPGATTYHVETHSELLKLPDVMEQTDGPLWVIASRNFLKLGAPWRAAFNLRSEKVTREVDKVQYQEIVSVPVCPACGATVHKDAETIADDAWIHKAQRSCTAVRERPDKTTYVCGSPLWESTWPLTKEGEPNRARPLFMPASWLKRHARFDLGIFDEVHELKGGGTAQGQMLGSVAACCDRLVALTGTLFGGKASDLYYLMWRLCPDRMKALGFEYGASMSSFVTRYGILQRTVKADRDTDVRGVRTKRRESNSDAIEKVGIVPTLFTDLLLDRAVFLSLEDLVPHLPPGMLPPRPRIEFDVVQMNEQLASAYQSLEGSIVNAIKESSHGGRSPNMGLVAAMFAGLDCYPDHPFAWDTICTTIRDEEGNERRIPICTPDDLGDGTYPKDRRLVEIVQGEVAKGRRCLVYTVHTQKHSVSGRLERILSQAGIRVAVLEDVATDRREEWVQQQQADGVQVIITHPGKVETGLDLLEWPTIIFHSMGLKPFTFRQAGARSWRIGQKKRCRVIALTYANTMQEIISSLMVAKIRAATRLEGQILEDLNSVGDEDITTQIINAIQTGDRPVVEVTADDSIVEIVEDIPEPETVPVPAPVPVPTERRIVTEAPSRFASLRERLGMNNKPVESTRDRLRRLAESLAR